MITLITGGARSGKSRHALELASEYDRKAFIATAQAFDDEMKDRITKHQAERGDSFANVEEPIDLAGAISSLPQDTEAAVVDCLTVWIGNLMHKYGEDTDTFSEVDSLLKILAEPPCDIILVANEVGMGIVPENGMARKYRDITGRLNQDIASLADTVIITVSGIPVTIKG